MNNKTLYSGWGRPAVTRSRRGNSIILVVGLIVLLLIVALSYLTRAQSVRSTAAAYRDSAVRDASTDGVAEDIASEIAEALFVHPIEVQDENGAVLDGPVDEMVRKRPRPDSPRYGVDPNFAWNFAPWDVVGYTNPPDWLTYPDKTGLRLELAKAGVTRHTSGDWNDPYLGAMVLGGTGAGANDMVLAPRENPRGGPGAGDTRWLRDTEPLRYATDRYLDLEDINADSSSYGYADKTTDAFSHWRHMTNLSRPGNHWRIVRDIADVTGVRAGDPYWDQASNIQGRTNWSYSLDPSSAPAWTVSPLDGHHYHGGLLERLDVPVEQWPSQSPTSNFVRLTGIEKVDEQPYDSGQTVFTGDSDFWNRWNAWFDPAGYRSAMQRAVGAPSDSGYDLPDGELIPPNFYDLSDLDGDGQDGEYYEFGVAGKLGEKPEDDFRKGTARWHVGRVLADSDGDGFTDSFWWLSPHTAPGGLMQVVGVSITDNSARLNANVATRFIRSDVVDEGNTGYEQIAESTRGATPADLALMGQGTPPYEAPWGDVSGNGNDIHMAPNDSPNLDVWSVGFLDNRSNWSGLFSQEWLTYPDAVSAIASPTDQGREAWVGFDSTHFRDDQDVQNLMAELGILNNASFPDRNSSSSNGTPPPSPGAGLDIHDRDNRLFYWQQAGLNPLNPGGFFTPFGFSEELELRSYEGNNLPWLYSRFEGAVDNEWSNSPYSVAPEESFFRAGQDREETSALHEQLGNRQLVADNRRKLTFFNSTRNDTMPPWLWLEHRYGRVGIGDSILREAYNTGGDLDFGIDTRDINVDGVPDDGFPRFIPYARDLKNLSYNRTLDSANWTPQGDLSTGESFPWWRGLWDDYHAQMRQKIDLRSWERAKPRAGNGPQQNTLITEYDDQPLSERLPMALLSAMTSGDMNDSWSERFEDYWNLSGVDVLSLNQDERWPPSDSLIYTDAFNTTRDTIHGPGSLLVETFVLGGVTRDSYSGDQYFEQTRQTAAMLAANMISWRDPDSRAPLFSMGWNINGIKDGDLGAVPLPRLDGWALNLDSDDPDYNPNYGAWRPEVEDMFVDGRRDYATGSESDYHNAYYPSRASTTNPPPVYEGNDFDGFGYPRLYDTYLEFNDAALPVSPMADPWFGASFSPEGQIPGNFVDGSDGGTNGYSPAEQLTRDTVKHVAALGMEAQPFITEAFVAHVAQPVPIPMIDDDDGDGQLEMGDTSLINNGADMFHYGGYGPDPLPIAGGTSSGFGWFSDESPRWILAHGNGNVDWSTLWDTTVPIPTGAASNYPDVDPAQTISVVQISNPYDTPLPLFDRGIDSSGRPIWKPRYAINLFGQQLLLMPQQATSGSDLSSVSFLGNLSDTDVDTLANPASSFLTLPIDTSTKHGMVLPPATHDRPYTLTVVSMPAASRDMLEAEKANKSRWSLKGLGAASRDNYEGTQWLDFLDLLPFDTGDGVIECPPPLQPETFTFEGDNYTIDPGDLVWVLRPRPSQAGRNDEVWATNRLFYDGEWDSDYSTGATVPERRLPLGDLILGDLQPGSGNPTAGVVTPAVELVRIQESRDLNGDGLIGPGGFDWNSGAIPPEAFEYGFNGQQQPVGDNTIIYTALPAQEIVIDRSVQWDDETNTWRDDLMESVTGLEWGDRYVLTEDSDGNSDQDWPSLNDLRSSGMSLQRLPQIDGKNMKANGFNPPIKEIEVPPGTPIGYDCSDMTRTIPSGPVRSALGFADEFEWYNSSYGGNHGYTWNLFIGNAFGAVNGHDSWGNPIWDGLLGTPATNWQQIANHQWKKAQETRWIQWARYARPWGVDPDWPYHDAVGTDAAVLSPGPGGGPSSILPAVDPPRRQMDWAGPRYVLGEGRVTRSFGRAWADDQGYTPGRNVELWDNKVPLLAQVFPPNANGSARTEWGNTNSRPEPKPDPSMEFAEQIVDYSGVRPGQFNGPNGELVYIKVLNDNDSPNLGYTYVKGNLPSVEDAEELARKKEATHLHGDLIQMDLPTVGWGSGGIGGGGGGGVSSRVEFGPDGGVTSGGVPYFPWLTRNQRMPKVFRNLGPDNSATATGFIYRNRKPVAFDMIAAENQAGYDADNPWSFPDKGVYSMDELPSFKGLNDLAGGGYGLDENLHAPFSFQMNHKDGNFEQVGEVLNVWTHAHMVAHPYLDYHYPGLPGVEPRPDPRVQGETIRTFSESLSRELRETEEIARPWLAAQAQEYIDLNSGGGSFANPDIRLGQYRDAKRDALRRVGRLEVSPGAYARNEIVGEPLKDFGAERVGGIGQDANELLEWIRPAGELSHLEPEQPAGQRVLDLFVCDGPGVYDLFDNTSIANSSNPDNWNPVSDGIIDPEQSYYYYLGRDPRFKNAHGFTGKGTPGLVNINTAPIEVMRALPHMYRMVHGTDSNDEIGGDVLDTDFGGNNLGNRNPRVAIPEAIVQYRDGAGQLLSNRNFGFYPGDSDNPFYYPELDFDWDGTASGEELAMATGVISGPSYRQRGTHTPSSNRGSDERYTLSTLQQVGQKVGLEQDQDTGQIYRRADGISVSSGTRGFRGIGQLFQLESPAYGRISDSNPPAGGWTHPDAWEIDFAAKRPFRIVSDDIDDQSDSPLQDQRFPFTDIGAAISTDVSSIRDSHGDQYNANGIQLNDFHRYLGKTPTWERVANTDGRQRERLLGGDMVAGDAEEANLLFSGISNMISTRSDMFTVHFRVRTFKPNPETGVWDATDSDAIIDDKRYVMLVDRSEVDRPGEKPKILYVEEIEN